MNCHERDYTQKKIQFQNGSSVLYIFYSVLIMLLLLELIWLFYKFIQLYIYLFNNAKKYKKCLEWI